MPLRQPLARRLLVAATSSTLLLTAGTSVLAVTESASATPSAGAGTGSPSDWTGAWIGRDNPATWPENGEQNPAPLLRKTFRLTKPVRRAELSIATAGLYAGWVDGRRIGDQVLDPAPSVFNKTVFSRTFDITRSLRDGTNSIGVELGRGYFGMPTVGGDNFNYPSAPWRGEPRLLAQLDVTFDDGTTRRIVTDDSWKIHDSGTRDNFYFGETFDARAEPRAWTRPGYDDSGWAAAPEQPSPTEQVVPATQPPMKVTNTLEPVAVKALASGARVYDFGRMVGGWARISGTAASGASVRMVYGEQLNDNGTVYQYQADKDPARHVDTYTFAGRKTETWEPSFTRHGFRYVEVSSSAHVKDLRVEARIVHNAVPSTGTFQTSNSLLNKIHDNQRRSLLDAFANMPIDTPWRDRQGWTADAYLFLDSAAHNFDVESFYNDWLRTVRDNQKPDGSMPMIAPDPGFLPFYNDPSWGGTVVLDVWDLYQRYGDKSVLSDNYSMLAKWMDLMDSTVAATGDIYSGFSFGDWAAPGAEKNGSSLFAPESPNLSTTADLFQEAITLSRIAQSLGRSADAARFLSFADRLRAAFNTRFFHPETNTYGTTGNPLTGNAANDPGYRQTSNVLPLTYGLVPEGHERAVLRNLVADIRARGNDLNTGASGTKHLLTVLSQYGYGGLAYKLANQTDYPSWGNWVKNGATSSWETWAITTPDQSMNHAFLGTVDDWFYQDLAGIQAARPGYARVLISPMFPPGLQHLAASVQSPHGTIAVRWTRQNGHLRVTIRVPRGVPATVRLPLSATVSKESGLSNTDTRRGGQNDYRTAHLDGGTHTFVVS